MVAQLVGLIGNRTDGMDLSDSSIATLGDGDIMMEILLIKIKAHKSSNDISLGP